MKVLVVEDDRKIKAEAIDDCLASLGHENDWATNQQEANELLVANNYGLILLDLQVPSRPGGKDLPEFGKNLLKQIRARMGQDMPVILMTAQHQQCVDLITELHEIGLDGSISKPFPTTGRTLAVVITEVMERHRRFRLAAKAKEQPLTPFAGGVLAFHARHIELCGETIVRQNQKGYAWRILHLLRETNDRGNFIRLDSARLAAKLHPNLSQNTLIQAIKALRERITAVMKDQLRYACGAEDVLANGGRGYHLHEWIVVEQYDDVGALATAPGSNGTAKPLPASPSVPSQPPLSDRQQWVLTQVGAGGQITRQTVEQQFCISERTAKRELGELVDAGLLRFDRTKSPGYYQRT
jgi:two-component system OmpR family response regulator